jgi:glycosyltransferase involved in cell wall biosynthesis
MKISGFTIARNAEKYHYPLLESISSILPICDEFVINVGDSEDRTLELVESLNNPKIRIIRSTWDMSAGSEVLSRETNKALEACTGDWAFYLQSDEMIHEADLPRLKKMMSDAATDPEVEALRFKWFHFYGSYYRYRIDSGWYQKQDRIIRNNGQIESFGDAFGFRRKDGQPLKRRPTGCFLYHYGWVQPGDIMAERRLNAAQIGFVELTEEERKREYEFGDLKRFPAYFGSHPKVMQQKILTHSVSQTDLKYIRQQYWWHPLQMLQVRYKTFRREKRKIT